MRTRILYAPSPSVLDQNYLKQFARFDQNYDDPIFQAVAQTATEMVEQYLGRFLVEREVTWTISRNQGTYPYSNLQVVPFNLAGTWMTIQRHWINLPQTASAVSAVNVGTWGQADTTLTAGTDYQVDLATDPGRIRMLTNGFDGWSHDHLTVTYTTGYGQDSTTIPAPIMHTVYLLATRLYLHRDDDNFSAFNTGMEQMLANYVNPGFG